MHRCTVIWQLYTYPIPPFKLVHQSKFTLQYLLMEYTVNQAATSSGACPKQTLNCPKQKLNSSSKRLSKAKTQLEVPSISLKSTLESRLCKHCKTPIKIIWLDRSQLPLAL